MNASFGNRPPRVAIASFMLESATFVPMLTTLADFQATECRGDELFTRHRGANTPIGGFLSVLEPAGVDLIPLLGADVAAAGAATDEAYEHYVKAIVDGLTGLSLDGVLLDLHGAMTTPTRLDADGETIAAVRRAVGPSVRLMTTFDYHANVDHKTIEHADAVFGYRRSPHVDMAETGARAADCMLRTLRGEISPVWELCRPDVMVTSPFSATSLEPLASILRLAEQTARASTRYRDITVFAGFSFADVPNCGFSALAVVDGDRQLAREVARAFSDVVRLNRESIVEPFKVFDVQAGIEEAQRIASEASRPVVLLEFPDRMNDSTYLLRAVLERGLGRTAVPYVWDPQAVESLQGFAVGDQVTVDVGGRSSDRAGGPVRVTGTLTFKGTLSYRVTGPYWTGRLVDLGEVVVIDDGSVWVSVTSRALTATDEDCFTQLGLTAQDFDFIVLRSKTHFRAAYEPIVDGIVLVDTPDWGTLDFTTLPFEHVDRERTYPFSARS